MFKHFPAFFCCSLFLCVCVCVCVCVCCGVCLQVVIEYNSLIKRWWCYRAVSRAS